mgnify:CR=1 FL=1
MSVLHKERKRERKGIMASDLFKIVADKWMEVISVKYNEIKDGFTMECRKTMTNFDEDIFHSTIVNCYNTIKLKGLTDLTEQGMKNYLFRLFKINTQREAQYSRNSKRDTNINGSDAMSIYEKNGLNDETTEEKIKKQLLNDYSVVHILKRVEENFDTISFYCFRLKWLIPKMTYQKLREITKVKDCKKRCIDIMKWLKKNINKEDILTEFEKKYV